MPFWKRLWLLFTVIWVVVTALNLFTQLAFGEEPGREQVLPLLLFGVGVPAVLYAVLWFWVWLKKKT